MDIRKEFNLIKKKLPFRIIRSSVTVAYWEALIPTVAAGCMKPSIWETLECVKCLLKKGVQIISEVFSLLCLLTFFERNFNKVAKDTFACLVVQR